jgi:DNA polymerase II large subunit
MEKNIKTVGALNGMIKGNRDLGRALVSNQKKEKFLGLMAKHGITGDLSKMASHKKEAFLKDVNRTAGIGGFDTRKALNNTFGAKKTELSANNVHEKATANKKAYEEIMNKRKLVTTEINGSSDALIASQKPILQNFEVSNARVRSNESLVNASDEDKIDNVRAALKRIQS